MSSSSSANSTNTTFGNDASPTTPTAQEQIQNYRDKCREIRQKKKNQDMGNLTAFFISSKYASNTLPSSGLERYFPKVTGYANTTPTNATKSRVNWRGKNVKETTPQIQPGDWFKPSIGGLSTLSVTETRNTDATLSSSTSVVENGVSGSVTELLVPEKAITEYSVVLSAPSTSEESKV